MGLRDIITGNGGSVEAGLKEKLKTANISADLLQENLLRLEMAVEDQGWRTVAFDTKREFTRGGLDDIIELSRVMYLAHPLIQRAVNVTTYYTWAQGATFVAEEDQIQDEVVEPQINDDGNRADLYGHQARIYTHVDQMCDGSIFVALFTNEIGEVLTRTIPVDDIRQIHTKPGDRQQIWYYRRRWIETVFNTTNGQTEEKEKEALYPDWRYQPTNKPESIGGIEVMWNSPIIQQRTGGLKSMQFGVPSTYSSLEWARAYKKFLEDWHTLVASLAKFAWAKTTKGPKIKRAKTKLGSTIPDSGKETNPPPVAGAVHIGTSDDTLTPIPKTGAHTSAEDARPSRLMVASAMDLPDTILSSDPQQGALATAKTLDRPTELGIKNWQMLWIDLHKDIFRYTVDARVRRNRLPGRVIQIDPGSGLTKVEPGIDPTVNLSFPSILEHDQNLAINSIIAAATLNGKPEAGTLPQDQVSHMLMEALGVEDVEAAMENLGDKDRTDLQQAVETLAEAVKK